MPQVDYSHIPFNETAETRRRPQGNNQQTRVDSIIEDITRARQNRPRIDRNDELRSSVNTHSVSSDNRSFIQTHPFLFGLTMFIIILAIVSAFISGQNFPLHSAGGNSNSLSQAMPIQNIEEPTTTVTNPPMYVGWEENTLGNEQDTEQQETAIPDSGTETDRVNDVSTEVKTPINDQRTIQTDEKQPRWLTDPPDVFMRTDYVR